MAEVSVLPLSPAGRRYGYKKDLPDPRDHGIGRMRLAAPLALPSSASNLPLMGPVLDQGQQGSCTAHAGVADREFLHWKQLQGQGRPDPAGAMGLFSPAFLYYQERVIDGTLDQGDCGSYGRTSCQALNKYGCATRAQMVYQDADFTTAPTSVQLAEAATWPTGGYHRLTTVDDMKSVIASGYNFRVGFTVYSSFESDWSVTGYMPLPTSSEQPIGGHEVLAIGYDDAKSAFLIRNSWGVSWGLSGNFWFPYAAVMNANIFSDGWVQHLGKPWK
jgi:hypothetical protein